MAAAAAPVRGVDMAGQLALLDAYAPTAPQRAAAAEFLRAEAEALASRRKSKCFVILTPEEAESKAGPGRVVFR